MASLPSNAVLYPKDYNELLMNHTKRLVSRIAHLYSNVSTTSAALEGEGGILSWQERQEHTLTSSSKH